MFSAADLLDALRRRRTLKSIRPEAPPGMPPGWAQWLDAMPAGAGRVSGAPPLAYVEQFLRREPRRPPRRARALSRWEAFATLWRQQWEPAPRDERALRVVSMSGSMVVHLVLAALLAWFMYVQFLRLLRPPQAGGEAAVVQVEWIGRGTPEDTGGGSASPAVAPAEAPAPTPARAAAASPPPAPVVDPDVEPLQADAPSLPALPVDVATPELATAAPPVPQRDIPTPPVPVEQPLQVTQVDVPDITFVLPPPTPRTDAVRTPELVVPTRDVPAPEIVEAVEAELRAPAPTVAIRTPDAARPALAVPTRAVPAPEAVAAPPAAPAPATPAPAVADAGTGQASATAATGASATGEAADNAADDGARADGVAEATDAAGGRADSASAPGRRDAGAGPETAAAPGGWPSPVRGDDWDDALRNRPGGQAAGGEGLFDGTGRPNLAGAGTDAGGPPGGAPPGSEAREAIDLERGGTWLQRPPLDYRPTRFDAFWIPTGTLLEEWVRRGIKRMTIPIPGSSKEIVCVVSILQLGGGCGISDPNLNEQPSSGRAAPDVPYKPELQEARDALGDPPGG